ncbi:aminotransferase class I/II-fold pyridoxal phosphate-dependent enzyme [Romboutsia ilealis]|uniref:Aminotransferase class I/II-fold pyridoxal phosphate-dependent enzyme n=1 Tax=Romboutsia faecis TaxID=2764597 RepID=A0ABR7JSU2_9FIRM|nr:aminotransferase class I/II-fold pyridoxal phosphate-dependent enzyme [Romboutsia faecis]MBC5997981.1 aminotransferase class I/II-fold pyridoxal phosphate-dependent enzyme [Romboutsia faecis]MRN25672.1 aminotransferase class I/II-fold pyridoxal phosphate-dependent enzyme [Romboutsia ilealis]
MSKLIIEELNSIVDKKLISFHVPGHKLGKIYDKLNYKNTLNKIYSMDTTEIPGTDNLHSPEGIIKESQERASEVFKSDKTYYLINGSTCGIQAAIMALCPPKSKIIANRDCHQSVINACILGDIDPVYINSEIDKNTNILKGINIYDAIKVIDSNLDAKAIILTYPTYYGMTYDLKRICDYAHSKDIVVIVDEAHGAHLGLSEELPKTALEQGADIVIQSTHKTLPSFTQSSMIHIQGDRVNEGRLVSILKIIESSSPSYILMASLEIAVDIYNKYGTKLMDELLNNINKLKNSFKENNNIEFYDTNDKTKIFISTINMGLIGYELETILREEYNIQVELSNYYGSLLICTIGNDSNDFKSLETALNEISEKYRANKSIEKIEYPNNIPVKKLTPREAFYKNKKSVKIYESIGKICGEYIIPYPPGISLTSPGEIITKEIIDYILFCKEKGMNVSGLKDSNLGQIQIIE